ncbi:MAG: ATP-binding cassette domain-containing protein [Sciscionella sp.]
MTTATSAALEAVDLVKTYQAGKRRPAVEALRGLSFAAETGSVFGLLGPNGAGKSTTVKILSTLSVADSGIARVAGIDVRRHPQRVRKAIGFVAQKAVTDPMATGTENLVLAGLIHSMSRRDAHARAAALTDRFGLSEAANRLVKTYSGGMARKLDVALGLMHRPQVLFLDEPTTGLDPQARSEMWAEIARMAAEERMTVLLTTHYLDEADRLATRLAIVDHGKVVVQGTPEQLKSELRGDTVQVELAEPATRDGQVRATLDRLPGLREVAMAGTSVRGRADSGARTLPMMLAALDEAGVAVASATVARPSLDDVYLRHTGRSFASAEQHTDAKVLEVAR